MGIHFLLKNVFFSKSDSNRMSIQNRVGVKKVKNFFSFQENFIFFVAFLSSHGAGSDPPAAKTTRHFFVIHPTVK
jgi:hypothetical protein